ncbi:hypothetical protein [Haloarchaeobius sp. TZWSO28]|uniref:hypothetical protein n=1 Tax=Haloarchaeobius sp. TZWSO28 TaxID=3446119 RepID=UPI003EBD5DD3
MTVLTLAMIDTATMVDYYVVVDGHEFEGPFEDRKSAKKRADQLNTNEVGGRYRVSKK